MAILNKRNTVVSVEVEAVEGTYVPAQSAESYVKTLADGIELNPTKEILSRDIMTGSIGEATPRSGIKAGAGTISVEMCAGDTPNGQAPEYDALMRSALGLRRQTPEVVIDSTDSGQSHTVSRIYLSDSDASTYEVGDTITIRDAVGYHTSPILEVSSVAGDVYIELLIPMAAPTSDSTVIGATTTYVTAETGHPSLSITKYFQGVRSEYLTGAKVSSLSLENWTTGQLASFSFGFDGVAFGCETTGNPFTPDYQECLPPIMLSACVYQDGTNVELNDFTFSVENTISPITATCSPTGNIGFRTNKRVVTGSMNPYKSDTDCENFHRFTCDTEFSLFATASNYECGDTTQYTGTVSFYIPKAVVTELSEADADGNLQDEISFQASRGQDSKSEEIYITFS